MGKREDIGKLVRELERKSGRPLSPSALGAAMKEALGTEPYDRRKLKRKIGREEALARRSPRQEVPKDGSADSP